jgi:tRNA U34 5-carboxymethylaminomethyl modifying enzyme MnmG/GidA
MREEMERDGSLAQFRLQVRENKCIAKLLESAKITEVAPQKETKKVEKKIPAAAKTKKPAKKSVAKTTIKEEEKRAETRKTIAQKRKPKGKNTR